MRDEMERLKESTERMVTLMERTTDEAFKAKLRKTLAMQREMFALLERFKKTGAKGATAKARMAAEVSALVKKHDLENDLEIKITIDPLPDGQQKHGA